MGNGGQKNSSQNNGKNQNNNSETMGIDFTNEIISCADIDFF